MISITHIFLQCLIYQMLQFVVKAFHKSKNKKSPPDNRRASDNYLIPLFNGRKSYFFYNFFSGFCLHKYVSPEIAGLCLQCTDTIVPTGGITFMFKLEAFYSIIPEKVFDDNLGLGFAVTVAFNGQCQFYILVKILRQSIGITGTQCPDYLIDCTWLCKG